MGTLLAVQLIGHVFRGENQTDETRMTNQ